ncbi:MAG: aromatic ring-hydroxylating dioxygenase subunit alpha [Methylophilaceae bacterium]
MYSKLSAKHYTDAGIFAQEQKKIFSRLWIFAGLANLLNQPDAFLTRTIADIPIVIQNFSGNIKAFENQCLHRQAPLQQEAYGKRPLACRYHGWSYDGTGHIKNIPHQQALYQFSPEAQDKLCLREFSLEIIGNLIFINLDPNPIDIEEQFTETFRDQLATVSAHFSDQVIHSDIPAAYNWKLNFENVLDYNHVAFVHPRTFRPLLSTEVVPVSGEVIPPINDTTLSSLSFATESSIKIEAQTWHTQVDRYKDTDSYYNFFIYPNVNFISLGGLVFLIQQYDPVSPGKTNVIFSLMTASEKKKIPAMPAILWGHLKGEKRVLDEDIVLLEALQKNLYVDSQRAYHGAYETQLQRFAEVYSRMLEAES